MAKQDINPADPRYQPAGDRSVVRQVVWVPEGDVGPVHCECFVAFPMLASETRTPAEFIADALNKADDYDALARAVHDAQQKHPQSERAENAENVDAAINRLTYIIDEIEARLQPEIEKLRGAAGEGERT